MKSSVAKNHRKAAEEQYPVLESVINDIWPKKGAKQQIRADFLWGKLFCKNFGTVLLVFYQSNLTPNISSSSLL